MMEIWVFVIYLVLSGALIAAIEKEAGWWLFTICCVMVGLGYFYFPPFEWFQANTQKCILVAVSYVIAGAVWGVFRWWRFCLEAVENYKEKKQKFLSKNNVSGNQIPDDLKIKWQKYLVDEGYQGVYKNSPPYDKISGQVCSELSFVIPKASQHKSKIVSWMTFWPWSALWFIFDDLIVNLFNNVYALIVGVFDQISQSMFKGFATDFEQPEESVDKTKVNYNDKS